MEIAYNFHGGQYNNWLGFCSFGIEFQIFYNSKAKVISKYTEKKIFNKLSLRTLYTYIQDPRHTQWQAMEYI